jgi:glycosidase
MGLLNNSFIMDNDIFDHLRFLYGDERAREIFPRLENIIFTYQESLRYPSEQSTSSRLSEQDAVLITYGDMVQSHGERPLRSLYNFLNQMVADCVNTIHILPFFPYTSDDGFSIVDYQKVDPALGDWSDVKSFSTSFYLMFDAVVNHVSSKSDWFKRFLAAEDPYTDYFIVVPEDASLDKVFRPRSLPLLTEVETTKGAKLVWTTFSSDQIDLNFANPDVLLEIMDTLLFYVEQGAKLIRLDAIAFIWKESGTSCIHLPQTHRIVQLMRSVLNTVAPHVLLITETNVPHEDNISYFGNGTNEAQMVYNFSLPPLTLHAFHHGNALTLSEWASELALPSSEVYFFNFLASHDGIGLTPARGLIAEEEVLQIAERVEALGGFVSYRNNPDGSQSPYELNIGYIDALGEPGVEEPAELVAKRFLAAQAIMLTLRGVPGIYFHSLFGSRSWYEGVEQSGHKRRINRQKLQRDKLYEELSDKTSLRARVFFPFAQMLRKRSAEPAFHPSGEQEIFVVHPALFSLWRRSLAGDRQVLCLQNVANETIAASIDLAEHVDPNSNFVDLLSDREFSASDGRLTIEIAPYGVYWLRLIQGSLL